MHIHRFASLITLLVVAALALSACGLGGSDEEGAEPIPTAVNGSTPAESTSIPVEALPDPLPEPYLFRDTITIETEPITETIYVVQPGDTLAEIADRFCLTIAEIQRLNTIVDITQISIGDELRIPIREGGCGAAAPEGTGSAGSVPEAERVCAENYTVQPGDTLANIAFVYGLTWRDIAGYNSISEADANNIQVGQILCIPAPPEPDPDPAEQAEETESNPEPPG